MEQGAVSKPPPLFESKDDGSQPDLKCVLLKWYMNSDTMESLDSYFEIFHPLMLHELWASICQQYCNRKRYATFQNLFCKIELVLILIYYLLGLSSGRRF